MAVGESWVLDGLTLSSGSFFLTDLTADPPPERQDWISAADSENAALFRQPLHENRTITMKLRITGAANMDAALDLIGSVVDKLRKASQTPDGIALVWTPSQSTRARTFDVLDGQITEVPIAGSGEGRAWFRAQPIFALTMTCKPYWRGTETLTSTASASTPFVTLEIPNVTGDVEALGRLIVTDTATQSRRHVEWGLEGPLTYNNALGLIIDSDSLVTSGFGGTQTTKTGAYDPNASGNNAITASLIWLGSAVCGTGNQSHVGSFRIKAHVWSDGGPTTAVRFSWLFGDGQLTPNPWVSPLVAGRWEELDLGTITIPATVVGTQRWSGQVEALDTNFNAIWIDYLILVPASDGYGKASAIYTPSAGIFIGHDEFTGTTAGGALNARTAPAGGAWATSGDTTDWLFSDDSVGAPEPLKRTTAAAGTTGRFGILGTATPTDVQVQTGIYATNLPTTAAKVLDVGVIARWTDSSNYVRGIVEWEASGLTSPAIRNRALAIVQLVAGTPTTIASVNLPTSISLGVWYLVRLTISAAGQATLRLLGLDGVSVIASVQGASTALATGGALASGKSGIFDLCTDTISVVRYFDYFSISTPPAEPIILYSGRNMQVRHDDTLRQDSTGTYTGRPQSYRGTRFLVPVGTSRVLVKARRNNVEVSADDNVTDATQIQVGWTQRGLAIPR